MFTERNINLSKHAMTIINFLMLVYFSMVIVMANNEIVQTHQARRFLETVTIIPMEPKWVIGILFSVYIIFIINNILRDKKTTMDDPVRYLMACIDIVCVVAIMFVVNSAYKGLLFYCIANHIRYLKDKKKYPFLVVTLIIYILVDYDFFPYLQFFYPVKQYVLFLPTHYQTYATHIGNLITSLNAFAFGNMIFFIIKSRIYDYRDIEELNQRLGKSLHEVQVMNLQLKEYALKTEEVAKTKERNRIARDIHDTLGHYLTGITTGLEACMQWSRIDINQSNEQMGKIIQLARSGLQDVRRSMHDLRPDLLENSNVFEAIKKLGHNISECTDKNVLVEISGDIISLHSGEEEVIYRIAQESITNAVRHSETEDIDIKIVLKDNTVIMSVRNDSDCSKKIREGFGLSQIRERVEALSGHVRFSCDQNGFHLWAIIPVKGDIND